MEYAVTATEDVPITDLSEVDEIPPDLEMQGIGGVLDCQQMTVNIWHFEEGDEIQYHAHAEQEELYYALEGRFSLKLGRSGEAEYREVGEGTFWVAAPKVGHGHRCLSEDGGTVLAVGAPSTHDPGLDPHSLDDEEIDEAVEEE
jgi:quercetin dioxygenase-like cupin family protein